MPPQPSKPPPLAVRLPDLPSVPDPWRGATYVLRSLLTAGGANSKLAKSDRRGSHKSWGLSLAPAKESGHQTCPSSTPGCRASCLFFQGLSRLDPVIAVSRIARTVAWKADPDWFERTLMFEVGRAVARAEADGVQAALRLNMTSDIPWEQAFAELFVMNPTCQFYDYAKSYSRMMRFLAGELPPNYSLTFSMSERNQAQARKVLDANGNVAVVFRTREFPDRFLGRPVIDGDQHDLRFLDPEGVVVALSAKGTAKHDETGFVVETDTSGRRLPLLT